MRAGLRVKTEVILLLLSVMPPRARGWVYLLKLEITLESIGRPDLEKLKSFLKKLYRTHGWKYTGIKIIRDGKTQQN